jgi:hypothetical protein
MTIAEFMAELQRRLEAHPDYRLGMRFLLVPEGATIGSATGYSWEPVGTEEPMRTISQRLVREVEGRA